MGQRDYCLKRYLSNEKRFADLINGIVGNGEQILSADDLTDMDSQVGYHPLNCGHEKPVKHRVKVGVSNYRDLLKKAAFGINFMVIGIEHQEQVNYLMPLRCMSYDVQEYERQASVEKARFRHQKERLTQAEFLSRFRKEGKLHPCITIVLYFGKNWDGARNLHELLDFSGIPAKLHKYINNYNMYLVDIQKLKNTDSFHTDLKLVFDCVRFAPDKEKFSKNILENSAYQNLEEDAYDVICRYTNLLELKEPIGKQAIGGKIDMCQAVKELMADSREEGRIEGMAKGKAELLLALLKEHGLIPERLFQVIMSERDEAKLLSWVKLAVHIESIQEFEACM